MDIAIAQTELRRAYLRGGPGAIVSGVVWLAAGITAARHGVPAGFAVLFFGGMLIFPIATFIVRVLFRRDPLSKENPGGLTVIETIVPMMAGLLAAWLLMPYRADFVFPMAAIAVGAHYFGFRTAYGDRTNWILGSIMCLIGMASIFAGMPTGNTTPYVISVTEIAFGCWLTSNSISKDH